MVKTVRTFSFCHYISDSHNNRFSEINKEYLGLNWCSVSMITSSTSLSTHIHAPFNPETNSERISMKVNVTMTNRNGEQFVETYTGQSASRAFAHFSYDADKLGRGEELAIITVNYDVEVTGVFPKQEKPKTRDFGASDPVLTDVVLVAGEQRFHVNKAILSTHSAHFRNLLATGNGEYKLENITPKALQELLQVLYHVPEIYDDNVEELLDAARKLDFPLVTAICIEYLEGSTSLIETETKKELIRTCDLELQTHESQMDVDAMVQENLDNVVLKVEDQRFHVSKAILATHSTYFHIMFFGGFRESKQSEIELKDIDPEAFQQLLEVLYHFSTIHETNVENLLHLARIYDAQPVTAKCHKFINGDNDFPMEEKQRLTEEYFPE